MDLEIATGPGEFIRKNNSLTIEKYVQTRPRPTPCSSILSVALFTEKICLEGTIKWT